jgi:predicted PurR-regulated permease PerM/methanogenic corrinoid protein MtbC1
MDEALSLKADEDRRETPAHAGVSQPIVAIVVSTAVLYFAKDIFIPLAIASLLAVIFSPVAGHLEHLVGRFASSAIVVVTAISIVLSMAYFLTVELTSVAVRTTDYTDNIANKITALKGSTPEWLQRIEEGVKDVERRLQPPVLGQTISSRKRPAIPNIAQVPSKQSDFDQVTKPLLPILSGLFESLIIVVLLFFLLYGRRDLRDRLVRLAARARITLSSEAIEAAGGAVGHYLLLFSLTNITYGVTIGAIVWLLDIPNPGLWGALAFVLRFVPYVGVPVAALLPTFVAFAVFPGWGKSLEVLASFVIVDQIIGYLVEPFLIGGGIGLSPLALLVSAMYWSWLWGLPGLLIATSLTACLKVAGDYIPALGFFAVLLGAEGTSEDYNDYYQCLLELDPTSAREIASRYCDKHGLEPTFDEVLIPAVDLAAEERTDNHISPENQELLIETTVALVSELGSRFHKPRTTGRLRIVGLCAPGEAHRLGLQMLLELLRRNGAAAIFLDASSSSDQIRSWIKRYAPDLVFLSCTMHEWVPAAEELVRGLTTDFPALKIIAGGTAAVAGRSGLIAAGVSEVCASRNDVRHAVRLYAVQRLASRGVPRVRRAQD